MRFDSILRALFGFSVLIFLAWIVSFIFDFAEISSPVGIALLAAVIVIGVIVIKTMIQS